MPLRLDEAALRVLAEDPEAARAIAAQLQEMATKAEAKRAAEERARKRFTLDDLDLAPLLGELIEKRKSDPETFGWLCEEAYDENSWWETCGFRLLDYGEEPYGDSGQSTRDALLELAAFVLTMIQVCDRRDGTTAKPSPDEAD